MKVPHALFGVATGDWLHNWKDFRKSQLEGNFNNGLRTISSLCLRISIGELVVNLGMYLLIIEAGMWD